MGNNSNDDLSKFRKGPGGRARVILGRRVQFTHGVFTWGPVYTHLSSPLSTNIVEFTPHACFEFHPPPGATTRL